jgi:putative DNA primase/helicase
METKDKKCLEPKFESIPDELKELDQWVCWRIEKRNSKLTKVPYNPKSKHKAKVNDPSTWGSFEEACCRYEKDGFDDLY